MIAFVNLWLRLPQLLLFLLIPMGVLADQKPRLHPTPVHMPMDPLLQSSPLPSSYTYPYQPNSPYRSRPLDFPNNILLLVVIMSFVTIILCYFCARHYSDAGRTAAARTHVATARCGLDKAILNSFPTMLYADVKELKSGRVSLECAVCIVEFDDADALRLLPKCSHAFHLDCIDMWLDSHATCPVCRADLTSGPDAPETYGSTREDRVQVRVEVEESEHGNVWTEEEQERFTLMLPESVRREVVMGKRLRRSVTIGPSARNPWRGGWGINMGRKQWAVKSDRWALLGRTWSLGSPSTGGESSAAAVDP